MISLPHPDLETGPLWTSVCDQSPGAYERLSDLVRKVCAPFLRGRGIPSADLDELLQDVLVSVWEYARRQKSSPRSFGGFLKWRARAVLSSHVRGRRSRDMFEPLNLPTEPVGDGSRPWDTAHAAELERALGECLGLLDERSRKIWEARIADEKDTAETAEAFGITRGHVALLLHRAKDSLWECLRRKKVL